MNIYTMAELCELGTSDLKIALESMAKGATLSQIRTAETAVQEIVASLEVSPKGDIKKKSLDEAVQAVRAYVGTEEGTGEAAVAQPAQGGSGGFFASLKQAIIGLSSNTFVLGKKAAMAAFVVGALLALTNPGIPSRYQAGARAQSQAWYEYAWNKVVGNPTEDKINDSLRGESCEGLNFLVFSVYSAPDKGTYIGIAGSRIKVAGGL